MWLSQRPAAQARHRGGRHRYSRDLQRRDGPCRRRSCGNLEAPEGNITGTSDAIPVEKIFELAAELTPDAESFGLIYNTGEVNSVSVIDETKAYLDAQGISYTEASVASTGDVQTAAQTLLSKCDAIFAPIDNTVASAMGVLADEAIKPESPCMWRPTAW